MEKKESVQYSFGLIGKQISYSFSRGYFAEKFKKLNLDHHVYENFDLAAITEFPNLLAQRPDLKGLNVTIPYKEAIIPYLVDLSAEAKAIGAVNTIAFRDGLPIGHNTDAHGFDAALRPFLKAHHFKALLLGTGGASKAVAHVLEQRGIPFTFVSRSAKIGGLTYQELTPTIIKEHPLIINCSPLGTFPNIEDKPALPYSGITPQHLLFDLIYNPGKTAFLAAGQARGASICNGLKMLEEQAEKAWDIWTAPSP
jgi:shikimate dehydrogenase